MPRLSSEALDISDKQRMRRFIASPITIALLLVGICIVGWKTFDMYTKLRTSRHALAEAQIAYDALIQRETFLKAEIETLSSDAGVEAVVRDRFGVAKEGERVIVILDDEEQPIVEATAGGWWTRVRGWFTRD